MLLTSGCTLKSKTATTKDQEPQLTCTLVQADVADKHQSIDKLHNKIQNLTDLVVQARYNSSHDLPIIAQEAVAGKTSDEQVSHDPYLCLILCFACTLAMCHTTALHCMGYGIAWTAWTLCCFSRTMAVPSRLHYRQL